VLVVEEEEVLVVVVVQRAAAIHTVRAPVRALDKRSIISPSIRPTPLLLGHDYDGSRT
jgi:hypothetical protein